ncbi:hypothetical protein PoB_002301100 [Plakobranchus ocellatus]|uniref:Uncharacterized protein n=1 Tax=Plakobranchus ocellatus TaxID=259542 RepID=A0AAV3ZPQ4_9GAST|nr:hypothetical protein PoB_002301100 [Plakobranchus ocellatus]
MLRELLPSGLVPLSDNERRLRPGAFAITELPSSGLAPAKHKSLLSRHGTDVGPREFARPPEPFTSSGLEPTSREASRPARP